MKSNGTKNMVLSSIFAAIICVVTAFVKVPYNLLQGVLSLVCGVMLALILKKKKLLKGMEK